VQPNGLPVRSSHAKPMYVISDILSSGLAGVATSQAAAPDGQAGSAEVTEVDCSLIFASFMDLARLSRGGDVHQPQVSRQPLGGNNSGI
jgi:hypothetical protein